MAESNILQGGSPASSAKMKFAGRGSYGKIPKVFSDDDDIVQMEFDIHDFENLPQKKGDCVYTSPIEAHGNYWKLGICPRGDNLANTHINTGMYGHPITYTDANTYVTIGLICDDENTPSDPVVAKASVRTKTITCEIPKSEFPKREFGCLIGIGNFATRKDLIENNCNEAGTLTVTVELQVATEQRSVWFPQLTCCDTNDIGTLLYNSPETSDITFIIGVSMKKFFCHKCVFMVRARLWYELVRTESSSSSSSEKNNNCIVLADVDETVFEVLMKFVYTGKVFILNDDDDDDDDYEENTVKSILLAANRFGVTELKLYAESILVEKFLLPSNAAALLLFADSYTCPLLKEAAMEVCVTASKKNMDTTTNDDDWKRVKESNSLLAELFVFATSGGCNRYSSVVDNGNGTVEDVDNFDVTSLRERLQKVYLDVDGSRTMLVDRWKNYLRANDDNKEEAEVIVVETEVEEEAVEVNEDDDDDFDFNDDDDIHY